MLTNSNFYIGDSSISRLYQGDNLVWDSSHPDILLEYIANGPDNNSGAKSVYYDTGVATKTIASSSSSGTKMEIKVAAYNESSQTWAAGEVNTSSWNGFVFYMSYPSSGSYIYARVGDQNATIGSAETNPYTSNQIVTMTAFLDTSDKNQSNQYRPKLVYNGITYSGAGYTDSTGTGQNIYLFTRNRSSGAIVGSPSGLKMYYTKIWEDNNLIRFYIPVLHWNNGQYVPCFYDKVNDTYIYNLGTDAPTYKIQGDYLLDYLGTQPETEIPTTAGYTGMQYDTGVVASTSLSVDIKGRLIWGVERNLFASATDNVTTPTWKTYGFTTSGGSTDADKCRLVFQWGANDSGTVRTFISMDSSSLVEPHRISMYHDNNNIAHGYLDDTFYTASNTSFNFSPNSIYLLNRHNNSVTTQAGPGTRVYYANFTISNIPAKTYIPVFHNNQAAFLDLNSGTYIYNMGTQIPYYELNR